MIDFYNILDDNDNELNGFSFNFISNFRIIDNDKFCVQFHKLFKRSYKGYENKLELIISKSPIDIKDIYNIELDEFKINKLYKGIFHVNFYENDTFDIFLKDYNII